MLALTLLDRFTQAPVRKALATAGIELGGRRPWDIRVHDDAFYLRMATNPAFQIGETYVDGMWDCDALDELFYRLVTSGVVASNETRGTFRLRNTLARVLNMQSRARAGEVALAHYDLDLDLYRGMLDDSLTYTCAYWPRAAIEKASLSAESARSAERGWREPYGEGPHVGRDLGGTLADAQRAKRALVCDKLELEPGQSLLDIGCGFGGLAGFAAEHYGVNVVGITNSRQHYSVARERYPNVEFLLMDYRDLPSLRRRFDAVSSIEMIEAVGPKNFATYMDVVHACLAPRGGFLLQSFISSASRYVCNEWFDRYIFPNGVVPSFQQLNAATATNLGDPVDVHELGLHYPPTLLAWDKNLRATWPRLRSRSDTRFQRMWHFYLTSLAGVFRAEDLRLCQILYRA